MWTLPNSNMKRKTGWCIAGALWAMAMPLAAQTSIVQENELAVVYYMPLTQIALTIDYEETETTPGVFYPYAERLLGATEVITEAKTEYTLSAIRMAVHTTADRQRAYKVVAQRGVATQLLALTDEGILRGYNIAPQTVAGSLSDSLPQSETLVATPMPLLEEQLLANSTAKMAEGAAKQIYHIRETRLNILAGDVEHAPADGKAMALVLDELNQREQQLTALFVGTKRIRYHRTTLYFTPQDAVSEQVVARFSRFAGVVAADDLSGEPIRLTQVARRQTYIPQSEESRNGKAPLLSQLYYNLPGNADLQLTYKDKTVSGSFVIAQYGVSVPLALELFTAKQTPHIYFNPQTGNISAIQQ